MNMKKPGIVLFFMFSLCFSLYSQSRLDSEQPDMTEQVAGTSTSVTAFRGISLGMSLIQVREILKKDPYFNFTGGPDVYILPEKTQHLIECSGNAYIKRASFQFYDNKLYIMIIELQENKIDFYSLFTTLFHKYGKYESFSPRSVIWILQNTSLSLERPVVVKYIDMNVFNALKEQGKISKQAEQENLQKFLGEF